MYEILPTASIFLLDRAHWLHCVSHKTREFSKWGYSYNHTSLNLSTFHSKISTKKIAPEHELLIITIVPVGWKLSYTTGDGVLVQKYCISTSTTQIS